MNATPKPRRTLVQLIAKHEADAAYATGKSKEWAAKANASLEKAATIKRNIREASAALGSTGGTA